MKRLLVCLLASSLLLGSSFNNKVSVECDMTVINQETIFGNARLYVNGRPAECKCGKDADIVSMKDNVAKSYCRDCYKSKKPKEEVAKK